MGQQTHCAQPPRFARSGKYRVLASKWQFAHVFWKEKLPCQAVPLSAQP